MEINICNMSVMQKTIKIFWKYDNLSNHLKRIHPVAFTTWAPECLECLELEILSDCIPLLKPIAYLMTELSGEKYLTISIVICPDQKIL